MSDFSASDPDSIYSLGPSGWPVVWINNQEPLPNQCITCGMFTDLRKAAKVSTEETQFVTARASNGMEAVGCLLHLLGPIGFIVSLALNGAKGEETVEQVVKVKSKIKLPICRLCAGQSMPEPLQGNSTTARYAFEVHPRFAEELKRQRETPT